MPKPIINVLLIEDNSGDAGLIRAMLAEEGDIFELEHAERLSRAARVTTTREGSTFAGRREPPRRQPEESRSRECFVTSRRKRHDDDQNESALSSCSTER